MTTRRILTVRELTRYIKGLLDTDALLRGLWVEGEISNFKHHTSGHMYFTLKDGESQIRCVMFRSYNSSLSFQPEDGLRVLIHGHVSVYERGGQYQLYAEAMEPAGLGSLFLAFEQLKDRLAREGLFDAALKRPLPFLPKRVGVVTSPTGAAIRDIIKVMCRRNPGVQIVLSPARVQGEGAAADIIRALDLLEASVRVDVIIVGRGGGSIEELWAFNDEGLARRIRACRVPVVSAVGHETDVTIADLVADVRAPTPSAAAEMVVPDVAELARRVESLRTRLPQALRRSCRGLREKLEALQARQVLKAPPQLREAQQRLDQDSASLERAMEAILRELRHRFSEACQGLEALSPLKVLARGYALCTREDGQLVRSVQEVSRGDLLRVKFADGRVDCEVRETFLDMKGDER